MMKRYIVELGTGADLHGMDVNIAAGRAVRDAVSHSCLCGLKETLGIGFDKMKVSIKIAAPFPEKVDLEAVREVYPYCDTEITVEKGGMLVRGISVPEFGEGDRIVVVNTALTVYVDV